jgi:hypothetical protein
MAQPRNAHRNGEPVCLDLVPAGRSKIRSEASERRLILKDDRRLSPVLMSQGGAPGPALSGREESSGRRSG